VAFPEAGFLLEKKDFSKIGEILFEDERILHLPKLLIQEGGYKLEDVPEAALELFRNQRIK
jgi:hypothetical protein